MKRFDLHIHTEATAPYLHGDANLAPYHQRGKESHLEFMGISDHFHYFWQQTRYLRYQRDHINTQHYSDPKMHLGIEQTILSESGRIGVRPSGLEHLEYIILAVHWMNVGGRLNHEIVEKILQEPRLAIKLIKTALNYYTNGMTNPRIAHLPTIIAHPFSFIFEKTKVPQEVVPKITPLFDTLVKNCAEHQVALEINTDIIPQGGKITPGSQQALYQAFFDAINSYKPMISLGSDAHRLENIGKIEPMLNLLSQYKVSEKVLLTPAFFEI